MLSFESDYICGAHESVLNKLVETNYEQLTGYGKDKYCESAKEKIKKFCKNENAQVFFLSGGTQTNQIVIDTMLSDYEGVLCADTGHINFHEAGAIEFCGHKVLPIKNNLGKITVYDIKAYFENYYRDENREHTTLPGMVYISHPTEYGTLYTRNELKDISETCKEYNVPLFMDGARLGYGLMSVPTDLTIEDINKYCDVFYIGGTKVGALCGEAVVFTKNNAPKHFFTSIKQHGALLAKGRLLGVQFDTLFTDDLYLKISKHAIEMANILRNGFIQKGYKIHISTVTNQIFVEFKNSEWDRLKSYVKFGFWERTDNNHTVYRIATSWATKREDVDRLIELL